MFAWLNHKKLVFLSVFLMVGVTGFSQESPLLFYIERSVDGNQIFYRLNLDETGVIDLEDPIEIYWIKHTEGGRKTGLTWVQKNFSYGLKFLEVGEQAANFQFVSYSRRSFMIAKDPKGNYAAFTRLDEEMANIKKIYVQIDGGSFWFPEISRVELHTCRLPDNSVLVETVYP